MKKTKEQIQQRINEIREKMAKDKATEKKLYPNGRVVKEFPIHEYWGEQGMALCCSKCGHKQ